MATYGGAGKNDFKIPELKNDGALFWTKVDATTGKTTVYRRYPGFLGIENNVEIGTIEKGKDFVPTNNVALGGFDDNLTKDERKAFLSDAVQKQVKQQALETAIKGNEENGVGPINSRLRANQLMDPDRTEAPSDPNQSEEDAQAQLAQQGLDNLNDTFDTVANSKLAQAKTGTRKGAGQFGDFSYPLDRNQSQDFMKFTLLEYKPKKIASSSGSGFGFSSRQRVGPNDQKTDRTILGSCSLPIPGGIKDDNGAEWAPQTMNALEAATLGLANDIFEGEGVAGAKGVLTSIGGNSEDLVKAIKGAASGAAAGVGKQALTRTTGMIFNPNLELLFDKPTLRGFTFTFDLVPRSKKEAEECIKIIRFFKQGMAPIRAASNLFLLSPNVFQVHYVLDGDGNKDHPYIGKMKECAMTNFRVDYTPQQNYSTLADGFMTAYKISMDLKELEPVFNDDYEQNGSESVKGVPAEIGF
jgi:hypothetical protein